MKRAFVILSFMWATPCLAQTDSTAKPEPHLCWRGKPAPKCSSFWITEFGFDGVTSTTTTRSVVDFGSGNVYTNTNRDFGSRLTWTVGPMFNTRPLSAVGGTLTLSPLGSGFRAAVEGRRRWWTPEGVALDLSAGLLRADVPRAGPPYERAEYGITTGAFLVGGDLINVNGRADLLISGGKIRYGTSFGMGLGSYAAAGGTVLLGALIVIALSTIRWD